MTFNNNDINRYFLAPSVDPNGIGIGLGALSGVTTATHNTAMGYNAGSAITTGSNNVLKGYQAGSTITTGANNVVIGYQACSTTLTTGSNNIIIGTTSAADTVSASTSNTFWLGGGATAIMSATGINGTPTVTFPGNVVVSGTFTGTTSNDIGSTIGGVSSGYTNTGSTLATVTGLSLNVVPGTYVLNGYLAVQCAATPGIKLSLSTSTATASAVLIDTWLYSAATLTAESNYATAALSGNLISAAVTASIVDITGTIVVTTAGTLTIQAAQAVSNATVLTITNGSYIEATRIA